MKLTTAFLILLTGVVLHASPDPRPTSQPAPTDSLPKGDQDYLHNFFGGINSFVAGVDIAQGVDFEKPPGNSKSVAELLKHCAVAKDNANGVSTVTFSGANCPMAYVETSKSTNTNPDHGNTAVRATITGASLANMVGVTSILQDDATTTLSHDNGEFHTDGKATNTYSKTRTDAVSVTTETHIDGVVRKSDGEIDIDLTHITINGTISYGVDKVLQMGVVTTMNPVDGKGTVTCLINTAPADCRQLAYILALDNPAEIQERFTEDYVQNYKEKVMVNAIRAKAAALAVGIEPADQEFLHNFFFGAQDLSKGLNYAQGMSHDKATPNSLKLAELLKPCQISSQYDAATKKNHTAFGGETCPVGYQAESTMISQDHYVATSDFTTCVSDIKNLTGLNRRYNQNEVTLTYEGNLAHTAFTETAGYETAAEMRVVVKNVGHIVHTKSAVGKPGTVNHVDFSSQITFGAKHVFLNASMDVQPGGMKTARCLINAEPTNCAQLAYILNMNPNRMLDLPVATSLAP